MGRHWYSPSGWLIASLAVQVVSLILFLVGFSTDVWVHKTYPEGTWRTYGLWRTLFYFQQDRYPTMGNLRLDLGNNALFVTTTDWYRATQAMECIALILFVISTFILFVYFFVDSFKKRNVLVATIILTFVTVVFIIIGVAIFAIKFEDYAYSIGWSMGLAIASAILAFLAAILEIISLQ